MAEAIEIPEGNVTLKFEGDERELVVDRKELAKRFKYFETLFKSDFNEANEDVITLKAEDVLSFESLKYLMEPNVYGIVTESNIGSIFKTADYLQMDEKSFKFLYDRVETRPPREILSILNTLHRLLIGFEFHNKPAQIIRKNLHTLMYDRDWLKLDKEPIKDILCCNDLPSDQSLLAMRIWINHDYDNRKMFFKDFIPLMMKGTYKYADIESMLETIMSFEPPKPEMDAKDLVIDLLLEGMKLGSLRDKFYKSRSMVCHKGLDFASLYPR